MKKYIILLLAFVVDSFFLTSCLEKYLDKAPESGLTETEVFSDYDNAYKFLDNCFTTSGVFQTAQLKVNAFGPINWDIITDFCDDGAGQWWQYHKWGPLGDNNSHLRSIFPNNWAKIRIANIFLKNRHLIKNGTQEEINDLIGRAYFVRAFSHFENLRLWGPMPYITYVIDENDEWDIPRLTAVETLQNIAADFDTAYTYFEMAGKIRRDPLPGQAGHLNTSDMMYPNGVTAKALKGRAFLYAGSPLNNGGSAEWEAAAIASWEAIEIAEQHGYAMLSAADYKKNYVGSTYTNEMLWGYYWGWQNYSAGQPRIIDGVCAAAYPGTCPTQGTVDLWETKWGDPLNTLADREAATALGNYNEQDPFVNRDPRFYIDVIYNGATIPGYGIANIYFEMVDGVAQYSEMIDHSYPRFSLTGYYGRKIWGGQSYKNPINVQNTCSMIRLAELYLNYAEAANEAYGPNTPAPNAEMTAVQAINYIRNGPGRWTTSELAPVQDQFTASKDAFRLRIQNERKVELCFEAHYYFDIRRWMIAPVTMGGPLMGNVPEKVPVSPEYPAGFKYTRVRLPDDRQSRWIDAKYYLPFRSTDYFKLRNFDPGQVW